MTLSCEAIWQPKRVTHSKSHVVHFKYMAHIEPCEHVIINGEKKIKKIRRIIMVMPSGQEERWGEASPT